VIALHPKGLLIRSYSIELKSLEKRYNHIRHTTAVRSP
jgi:hypothetical protein